MAKKKTRGVFWRREGDSFIPTFTYQGESLDGVPRPFPQFVEGERKGALLHFMDIISERLFGTPTTLIEETEDGEGLVARPNPDFTELPFMRPDESKAMGWVMNNGNPDIMGMFGDIWGEQKVPEGMEPEEIPEGAVVIED